METELLTYAAFGILAGFALCAIAMGLSMLGFMVIDLIKAWRRK